MHAPERLDATRIVASPAALEKAGWGAGAIVMRISPDEVLVMGPVPDALDDPQAIVEREEGFVGLPMSRPELEAWMDRESEWRLPGVAESFTQGMVAGLPVKIRVDGDEALVITRVSLAAELVARL